MAPCVALAVPVGSLTGVVSETSGSASPSSSPHVASSSAPREKFHCGLMSLGASLSHLFPHCRFESGASVLLLAGEASIPVLDICVLRALFLYFFL